MGGGAGGRTATMNQDAASKFVFGGMGCMAAAMVTNPIDVVKTRMQLYGELGAGGARRIGFVACTKEILAAEGVTGMYKGLCASLWREGTYSTLRLGGYDVMKGVVSANEAERNALPFYKKLLSGAVSGSVGAAIANPTDLVKVRMQADASSVARGGEPRYRNLRHAVTHIIRHEGFKGLYKGVGPTTQRAAILTATQTSSYDHVKHWMLNRRIFKGEGPALHFASAVVAGLACATTTAPVDLLKTRVMTQKVLPGEPLLYRSTFDACVKVIRSEGVIALYKGWLPQWLRIGPHTLVSFLVYEQLRRLAGIAPV